MFIIVDKHSRVVKRICESYEVTAAGNIKVGNEVFVNQEYFEVAELPQTPDGVYAEKYKYVDGQFVVNEDFIANVDKDRKITELESRLQLAQKALDEIILGGAL